MAKKRRVNTKSPRGSQSAPVASDSRGADTWRLRPLSICLALLGGVIVYLAYYPSDSVAVEKGDALWFGFAAITLATITLATIRSGDPAHLRSVPCAATSTERQWPRLVLDWVPWLLAAWMMLAAFASSPPGNLRMASNEAWLWVSAAALFTSARRLLESLAARRALLLLLIVCATALAVHGMHQYFVSLPENRLQYQQDPERILELAGIDAPPGSSERMVFENRLLDGGPTGTFALANSLAAILLVGVIGSLGVLRIRWSSLAWSARVVWFSAFLICAACLMAARSRSATLAMLMAAILVFVVGSRLRRTRPSHVFAGLAGITVVGLVGVLLLALFGNPEWFEEAPASLAFRFQYWRSTWQMVIDRPLLGAGPGNFQSIYERYREASATEQVAEPHNFLFETLAAGGFVALGLLVVMIVAGLIVAGSRWSASSYSQQSDAATAPEATVPQVTAPDSTVSETTAPDATVPDASGRWFWLGAGAGLLFIWLLSVGTQFAPDLDANIFALPTAILTAVLLWPTTRALTSRDVDLVAAIVLMAIMVHLLVAGGWTVPGVVMSVWLLSALLTRTSPNDSSRPAYDRDSQWFSSRVATGVVLATGIALLAAIYWMSLKPVRINAVAMADAEYAQARGQFGRAKASLQKAIAADPWSVDATLWMADFQRWQLVLGTDSPSPEEREKWDSTLEQAKSRAGDDPAVYRIIGGQQLHLYQRFGQPQDLQAAARTFQLASDWSPSNQWMTAQGAVIAEAMNQKESADQMARRAWELSHLGGNIERSLDRQQVFVAEMIGEAAKGRAVRRSASELLANQLDRIGVQADK